MSENHKMKFTVLAENHEASGLECEHGLSIFIEYKRKNICWMRGSREYLRAMQRN